MAAALISVAEARARIADVAHSLPSETIPVGEALDRVLARELRATGDVPGFACSAMDGFAVRAAQAGQELRVTDESRAGRPAARAVGDGEAIRISTGAAVPHSATTVVRQEDTRELSAGRIELLRSQPAGANIRRAGEDLARGALVLGTGTRVGVAELGAAVACGAGELAVARRPSVAVMCTGDELRAPGASLAPGEIHNSNAVMLRALALRSGAEVVSTEILKDDPASTEAGLSRALAIADLVLISGGVSVGPHDHVRPVLARLGARERFWGVALQPGKPTWFGTVGRQLVFGLPGNPVSAVVTFTLFARLGLDRLQGTGPVPGFPGAARLAVAVATNPHREQAMRVSVQEHENGLWATPNGAQGSHRVSSLLGARALAMIPRGDAELPAGTKVRLQPLVF